jgi:hypothetical protein
MAWRKQVGIDELWEERRVRKERTTGDYCSAWGLCGRSKGGGCVMVEKLGRVDLKGIVKDEEVRAEVIKAYIIYLERAFRYVRATGKKTKSIVLVDMDGVSMSFLMNIAMVSEKCFSNDSPTACVQHLTRACHLVYTTAYDSPTLRT